MFATHQKTSSGRRALGPQPVGNHSKVEPLTKSVPRADGPSFKDKTRFFCFYCNHLSYSQSELNHHMVQKHSLPFKCQFCDFGSLTRDHVFRHMREMHASTTADRPMNLIRKHPTVSNALPRPASMSTTSSVSSFAQITASCSDPTMTKVNKDGQRGETVKSKVLPKDGTELFAPLNEQIENNKSLTIALPKEVTIPAGCFVELIEVNTVNGKKELKLRLVSQQPSGSLVKDCSNTTSQKATTVAAAASSTASPIRGNGRTCTANRLTRKRKNCNQHVPKNSTDSRSHFTHFQITGKDEPTACNSKGSAIRPETKNKELTGEHCVSHSKTQHLTSPPATGVARTENIQAARSSTDFQPETNAQPSQLSFPAEVSTKQLKIEERNPLSDTSTWTQSGGWDQKSFEDVTSGPEALPVISCVFSLSRQWEYLQDCPRPLLMALRRMAAGDSTPPVKTSLIYDKQTLALATSQDNNIETGNTYNKVDGKDLSALHEQRITPKTGHQTEVTQYAEELHDQHIVTQILNPLYIKKENRRAGINSVEESTQKQCVSPSVVKSTAPAPTKSLSVTVQNEAPPSGTSHIDPSMAGGISGSVPQGKTNEDICPRLSSYLTIPLKRIKLVDDKLYDKTPPPSNEKQHVTLSLRRRKKRKLWKIPRPSLLDSPGNFVGLKADQHVKQPGPNQPVVVLNLAKPQTLRRKAEADSVNDAESEVIPTCHILKMKLNKVMGQKYEVSGCTVRLCLKEG